MKIIKLSDNKETLINSINENYEIIREKIFYYVLYQKRSESEVKNKFWPLLEKNNISYETFENLIEELKEKGYIDDKDFISRKFKTFMKLNNFSIKEIEIKLMQKGISKKLIEEYIENNYNSIYNYQITSIKKIYNKKICNKTVDEVKNYLLRKGFVQDIIEEALSEIEGE